MPCAKINKNSALKKQSIPILVGFYHTVTVQLHCVGNNFVRTTILIELQEVFGNRASKFQRK